MNILEALIHIRDQGPDHADAGICRCATLLVGWDCSHHIQVAAYEWPKHSGLPAYPVPSTTATSARTAYWYALDSGTMWRRNTEYGKLRWELLDYLIEKLSSQTDSAKAVGHEPCPALPDQTNLVLTKG